MFVQGQSSFTGTVLVGDLANPALPMLIARIKRVIAGLTTVDFDHLGGDGTLAYVRDHAQLEPLAVDTQAVEWSAGALEQDGQKMLRIAASLRFSGDHGLLTLLAAEMPDAPMVTVTMTDTRLVVTATGAVTDPEELVAPVKAMIERIDRVVTLQALRVDEANTCAGLLAASQLGRRARSGLVARH